MFPLSLSNSSRLMEKKKRLYYLPYPNSFYLAAQLLTGFSCFFDLRSTFSVLSRRFYSYSVQTTSTSFAFLFAKESSFSPRILYFVLSSLLLPVHWVFMSFLFLMLILLKKVKPAMTKWTLLHLAFPKLNVLSLSCILQCSEN